MRTSRFISAGILAAAILSPAAGRGDQYATNRLTFSARFGFNISARFKGLGNLPAGLVNTRSTPTPGYQFNYDDGYAYPDSSGSYDGLTWFWGYDEKATQFSPETTRFLMHRSTPTQDITSPWADDDPSLGAELSYVRLLGARGDLRYGFELAANYLNLCIHDHGTFRGNALRTPYVNSPLSEDPPFDSGGDYREPPPVLSDSGPWYQPRNNVGYLIDNDFAPAGSPEVVPGGVIVSGKRQYEADLWGFRLGPYLEFPICKRVTMSLVGGLAVAIIDGEAAWQEQITIPINQGAWVASGSGSGSDAEVLWGFYAGANLAYQLSERWSATVGAQYQNLGKYQHAFGGREVEVDLSRSVFLVFGLSYKF